jgi:hypothetical protein
MSVRYASVGRDHRHSRVPGLHDVLSFHHRLGKRELCVVSKSASGTNATAMSTDYPKPLAMPSESLEHANLNAAKEFLKDELPRIFREGVRYCSHLC